MFLAKSRDIFANDITVINGTKTNKSIALKISNTYFFEFVCNNIENEDGIKITIKTSVIPFENYQYILDKMKLLLEFKFTKNSYTPGIKRRNRWLYNRHR